jgi:hypothetical protein
MQPRKTTDVELPPNERSALQIVQQIIESKHAARPAAS